MDAYELLAKAGARVTYFCAYCGYEFKDPPKLPAKCPRCGRELAELSMPMVELKRMSFRRWGKRWS